METLFALLAAGRRHPVTCRLLGCGIAAAMVLSPRLANADPAGFQIRGGLGVADAVQPGNGDRGVAQSPGLIGALYLGASLKRGLFIGGFFQDLTMPWANANLWTAGPYLDFYPIPAGGLRVTGKGGFGQDTKFDFETTSTFAFSLSAGVGYDFWTVRPLSFGLLADITYAWSGGSAIVPAVFLTLVYQ